MAIDIRATVTCSLGTLISGSISDDYLQGSGLVKTKGSVEISGTITPAIGTVVTFSYVKGGVTRSIPRKLRVMSSFADPFRRTTKVELGCKLTYLSDLKDRLDWTAFDDPENAALTEADAEIITIPIRASSIMTKCLTEIGITASSSPLTNQFSIPEFDFSAGYVQILSDLLVSESYFGYLDTNEVLQVRNLAVDAGTGPVFTSADIVDLGPIGVGQLPGEAVTVSYSTLKLKDGPVEAPEEEETDLGFAGAVSWGTSKTFNKSAVVIGYTDPGTGEPASKTYNVIDSTEEQTLYGVAGKDDNNVVIKRIFTERTGDVTVAGSMVTAYLNNGIDWSLSTIQSDTEETFKYDSDGNEIQRITTRYGDTLFGYGSVGLPMVFSASDYVAKPAGRMLLSKTITDTLLIGEFRKTITSTYGAWIQSISGQQSVAESRETYTTASQVEAYLSGALSGSFLLNVSVAIDKVGSNKQEVPSQADVINAANATDEADPANNYRTESVAELELAVGSSAAQRRIELSMPYAPDDRFIKTGSSPATYTSVPSDAPQKSARYGRTQNRLLLGNRNGINLQLAPERLPAAPFEPLYVQANGLTAQYRANGTSWAFDSNGIVASVDALFWSAVGGTGTFWFPVAPGVTTLPTTPAIVDGTMNPATVVLPYNETAVYNGILRTRLSITKFDYSLSLLTEVPAMPLKLQADVRRILKVEPPAGALTLAAQTPRVSSGGSAKVPVAATALVAIAPEVNGYGSVFAPAVALTVAGLDPEQVGKQKTQVFATISQIITAALAPRIITDPYLANVSLLLHMDGSNGSTTFTDSSSNAITVTGYGNAQISTAQSKFGGASAYFDGSGDYLLTASSLAPLQMGTGDFTMEAFIRPTVSVASYRGLIGLESSDLDTLYILSGQLVWYISGASAGTIAVDTWYHVAASREGTSLRVFIDGVLVNTSTNSNNMNFGRLRVGSNGSNTGEWFHGWMDELRITKGVARYTANFTAPTAPFPDA